MQITKDDEVYSVKKSLNQLLENRRASLSHCKIMKAEPTAQSTDSSKACSKHKPFKLFRDLSWHNFLFCLCVQQFCRHGWSATNLIKLW